MSERIPIPLHHSSVRAVIGAAGEVVYVGGELVFVDARTWPPAIRRHGVRAFDAARSVSGRWLAYAGEPDARYEIHWYDSIAASEPASILPDPCPPDPVPDDSHFQSYGALPDDRQPPRPPQPRVESVHVLGEQAVLVPAHVDIALLRPLVYRDERWSPLELPPYEASLTSPRPCRVACARLADGTDVVGWDGRVYAHRDGRLEPLHDDRLAIVWVPWEIVPSRDGGFFAVDAMQLFELRARARIEHLPGRSVGYLRSGPRGMLRVHTPHDCLLYDPARDTVISIGNQIQSRDWIVGHTDEHLLVHDPADATLRRLSLAQLEQLPRQVASVAPAVPPLAIVDEHGTLSRARIAATGTRIVMAYGKQVRHHAHDTPDKLVTLTAPVVAVAQLGARTGALDAAGRLHVFSKGTRTATAQLTQTPRDLSTVADRWLVIGADRCRVVDADGTGWAVIDFPGGLAAAADPDGAIVILGEGRRLALYERSGLVDLPGTAEQLVAIVALGRRRFLCAGQSHLFVLDLGNPELEIWVEGMTSPHLAVDPARAHVAFAVGVEVLVVPTDHAETPRVRARIDTFELADHIERRIHGLHYLADGRLVVALPVGAGWILDLDATQDAGTKRMDPHPGDVPSRYTFTIDGRRLVG